MAWETTTDDLATVFKRHGITKPEFELEKIHDELDHDKIEHAALCGGTEIDDQTEAAYSEIADQLKEGGHIANERKEV